MKQNLVFSREIRRFVMDTDTIVAVSTAPGAGLKGIIRISGTQAFSIVNYFWNALLKPVRYKSARGHLRICSWHTTIPATLYLMKAPHSYTREDCVEIHTISSAILLEKLVKQFMAKGARPALPGEFTRRAFLAGRIDLAQAEAVMSLIAAKNEAERRMAIIGVSGVLSQKISQLQDLLTYLIALVEAHIDFLEEEVPPLATVEVVERLTVIKDQLASLGEKPRELSCESITVCLHGLANAGKSTLFNTLVGRDQALTSEIPGTTLDWLEGKISLQGIDFTLIDTPGIDESPLHLQAKAQQKIPALLVGVDIVLYLIDKSSPFDKENEKLLQNLPPVPTFLIFSKSDLADGCSDGLQIGKEICDRITISTTTGEGLEKLKNWLTQTAHKIQEAKSPLLLTARQYHATETASRYIQNAIDGLYAGLSYEFIAVDLRSALDCLGEIAGQVTTEEILDHVFSQFCIGK